MCVMAAVTYSINQTTHKPRCGVRFTLEGKRPYGSGEQIKWEPSLLGNPSCQFWEIQSEAWPGDYYHLPGTVKEGIGRLHLMTTQTTRYRCNQNHFKSKTSHFLYITKSDLTAVSIPGLLYRLFRNKEILRENRR